MTKAESQVDALLTAANAKGQAEEAKRLKDAAKAPAKPQGVYTVALKVQGPVDSRGDFEAAIKAAIAAAIKDGCGVSGMLAGQPFRTVAAKRSEGLSSAKDIADGGE